MEIPNFADNPNLEAVFKNDKKNTPTGEGSVEQKLNPAFNEELKVKKDKKVRVAGDAKLKDKKNKKVRGVEVATPKSNTTNPFQPKEISYYKEQLPLPTGQSKIYDLLKIGLDPDGIALNQPLTPFEHDSGCETILPLAGSKKKTPNSLIIIPTGERSSLFGVEITEAKLDDFPLKNRPLTAFQTDLLYGAFLGDASLRKKGNLNSTIKFEHSSAQTEWNRYKYNALQPLVGKFSEYSRQYAYAGPDRSFKYTYFTTKTAPVFNIFNDLFYENKKKLIRPELCNYMKSNISLITWYLDDGTRDRTNGFHFATNAFDSNDLYLLQKMLKKNFGLE